LFQAIGCFKPTFIEVHQASKIICIVSSLKSQIKTSSFLEEIITSNNEVFEDFESDMAVEIGMIGNLTRETVHHNVISKKNTGS